MGGGRAKARERKQYPTLNAYTLGVRCMGLFEAKRPVVLIVEDEFLLRMDAVDMIAGAGFEVLEAGNAERPSRFWNLAATSPWFSPISRCRARWTV
jgi:hypothetical protein